MMHITYHNAGPTGGIQTTLMTGSLPVPVTDCAKPHLMAQYSSESSGYGDRGTASTGNPCSTGSRRNLATATCEGLGFA